MANFAAVLKQEIMRLARKEARSLTKPLHKATAGFRKSIAELKRENARARADIVRLLRKLPVSSVPPLAEAGSSKVRFSAASAKAQRRRLGLSAADFGKLIGVTGHTVYAWEQDKSRPRNTQLAAFAALRGIGKREAKSRLAELQSKGRKKRKTARAR
jgi:DNA-binding XRE family transcriptional regulator